MSDERQSMDHMTPLAAYSAPFEPTLEQAHTSAILHACWRSGMTERQVIEVLWRAYEEQTRHLMRAMETQAVPRIVVTTEFDR